jgi:uncharacterized protein YbcC (UPF0753/DUF2309 family)
MLNLQTNFATKKAKGNFVPPAYQTPHVIRQFEDVMAQVADVIAPVWPLKDYVAVNPYAGVADRSFMDARAFMKVFSDCETLMPTQHYASEFQQGKFGIAEIDAAVQEMDSSGINAGMTGQQISEYLNSIHPKTDLLDQPEAAVNQDRHIRTIAEYVDAGSDFDWSATIRDEVSKHCADHYDEGQAIWGCANQNLTLFQAWRSVAQIDRNVEVLGMTGFRSFVSTLPATPDAAIVHMLQTLHVPEALWSTFLLCQAFSIPGWSAWAKYQTHWLDNEGVERDDLAGLLAMRLAYDVGLANVKALQVNWENLVANDAVSFRSPSSAQGDDSDLRYTLLRASEIALRNNLVQSLTVSDHATEASDQIRMSAQMVFCIDVRSERIRRHLESVSSGIETFGFAGFFGMPIEFVEFGLSSGTSHVPVLLKPKFKLHEGMHESDTPHENKAIVKRHRLRTWRMLWKNFQTSAVGCFSFVETFGLIYGCKLMARAAGHDLGFLPTKFDGLAKQDHAKLGPTLRNLNHQGITTSHQADLAESMLRNLGLTKNLARLVVFCGHACQVENNPLAAGLDCGACGGHSGEPNARFAAMLLNQPYIRSALDERGIRIPDDTHFIGALHNTTTDAIRFFEIDEVPTTHLLDLQQLISDCASAGKRTRTERLPIVRSKTLTDLVKRATDWSEVRPEWGLAGNAAFIVAPRSMTQSADLDGRAFLHSYDHKQDPNGSVLETIMTAPMVVAHWINMQYYASTVDNHHFGSGNKTVHNVVGRFGILSGGGGDLMTGLPWQSLHTGDDYQHLPLRLQSIIAAPRESIDRVIAKHDAISNLLSGGWLHLIAIEDGQLYRYDASGTWRSMASAMEVDVVH